MFSMKLSKKARKTFKFIRELPKRLGAFRSRVPYVFASRVLSDLKESIPQGSEWNSYREGLEIVGVSSRKSGWVALRLPDRPTSTAATKVDPPRTLLYVHAHRRLTKVPPLISVLAKYSPWTADTLPFMPSKKDAVIVSRKSTKQVAMRVANQRKKDRPFWSRELQKAGRRDTRKSDRLKTDKASPMPDYAYQALRLEFGLGIRAAPHWRPALSAIRRSPIALLQQDTVLMDYLDPKSRGWRSRSSPVKSRISKAAAKKFVPFQRRLGL